MSTPELNRLSDVRPLARRAVSAGESTTAAIFEAFETTTTDPDEGEALYDQVEPDALDSLLDGGAADPRVLVELWSHPVVVTSNWVAVYPKDAL
ncbi:MAG: HalOD1 output domain-containing protein [Haloferacaceae archaeon]